MKAIQCRAFGPLEDLHLDELPNPVAGANEVIVGVCAAGVNFPDTLLVQGLYQAKPTLPFTPGKEFAGLVLSIGSEVTGFAPGDRVFGFSGRYGAWAEEVLCHADELFLLPENLSFEDGAGLFSAFGTAHHGLKQRGVLQPGETVLVTGASGGTGLAAVQIAKAMGARVIAACSTDAKLETARAYGADMGVNYTTHALKDEVKRLTDGVGVDVVYDPVGDAIFDAAVRCLKRNGRLLVVGFAGGEIPRFPVNLALVKEISVTGVFWGSFKTHEPQVFEDNMRELLSWCSDGQIRVKTDTAYALNDVVAALTRFENRDVVGKLVLRPGLDHSQEGTGQSAGKVGQ